MNMKEIGLMRTLAAAVSIITSRMSLAGATAFNGRRDYNTIFGYAKAPTMPDHLYKYDRQDIVARIIDSPVNAIWSSPPKFTNPAQQKQWDALQKRVNIIGAIQRADRLARLGRFSLLILGTDTGTLDKPLRGKLMYVLPVSERYVDEITYDTNVTSERYARPTKYKVKTRLDADTATGTAGVIDKLAFGGQIPASTTLEVHHSRVIHIVENPLENPLFGTPIMTKIYNLLDDLLKVTGGTAETFWIIANRGLQIDVDKDMAFSPEDGKALTEEIDELMHGLRRYIRTRGVEVKNLGSDSPQPMDTFDMIISLLSGATGIPKRILTGSEAGQLASEQDRANWAERIEERRRLYATPTIMHPLLMALMSINEIGGTEYELTWESAFLMSPLEEAQVMSQKGRAIGTISKQTGNNTPMQITSEEEARNIIGLKGKLQEADRIEPDPGTNGGGITDPAPANDNPSQDGALN